MSNPITTSLNNSMQESRIYLRAIWLLFLVGVPSSTHTITFLLFNNYKMRTFFVSSLEKSELDKILYNISMITTSHIQLSGSTETTMVSMTLSLQAHTY